MERGGWARHQSRTLGSQRAVRGHWSPLVIYRYQMWESIAEWGMGETNIYLLHNLV